MHLKRSNIHIPAFPCLATRGLQVQVHGICAISRRLFAVILLGMSCHADIGAEPAEALAPCPESPNCVSSQALDSGHHVAPLSFTGPAPEAWAVLRSVLQSRPRTTIVQTCETYLHAEARSAVFRFVDDVEFLLMPAQGVIHVRSASRVGYSDLGVNRRRVEAIRSAFQSRLRDAP
jgi:uncharacterized protein (DUF1499 family)